jgi:hypothetical protein
MGGAFHGVDERRNQHRGAAVYRFRARQSTPDAGNAMFLMKAYTPVAGIIALIGTFLVFALPQFFQAEVVGALDQIFGDRARFAALLALPLTAVLPWYCYDYLTPSNLCFAGNCMGTSTVSPDRAYDDLGDPNAHNSVRFPVFRCRLTRRVQETCRCCSAGNRGRDWRNLGLSFQLGDKTGLCTKSALVHPTYKLELSQFREVLLSSNAASEQL